MIIQYNCEKCGSKRFLSKVENKVFCKSCGSEMEVLRKDVHSDTYTTEESRFIADEALYNTVGDRTTGLKRSH